MLDYVQQRTGDNAAVDSRSVMLHLLSDITPAFKVKTCHFDLKLASVHISYQQGNYQFRKSSLQGSCFSYLNCFPLLGLSCPFRKQSWFTRTCLAFLFSLLEMTWSVLVLYSVKGMDKGCCQTGFSSPCWDTLQEGQMSIQTQTQTHPLQSCLLSRRGLNLTWCLVHCEHTAGLNSPSW